MYKSISQIALHFLQICHAGFQYLANAVMDQQVGLMIVWRLTLIDQYQLIAMVVINKTGCRINNKGSTSDDQHVG